MNITSDSEAASSHVMSDIAFQRAQQSNRNQSRRFISRKKTNGESFKGFAGIEEQMPSNVGSEIARLTTNNARKSFL